MNPGEIAQTLLEAWPMDRGDPEERLFLIRAGVIEGFYQCGGDASPAGWGGTWYCPKTREMVHFEGLANLPNGDDTDPSSDKVTKAMTEEDLAKIAQARQGLDKDEDWMAWDNAE